MEEKEIHDELASIRSLMERSSKFISLSGLSGILAGVYALIGAGTAYKFIRDYDEKPVPFFQKLLPVKPPTDYSFFYGADYRELVKQLFVIALLVLVASITTAVILSKRQAKKKNQPMWGAVSRQLLFHMAVPLLAGGLLILIFLSHRHYGFVSSSSLIFYGIALVSASNFTFGEVKYLGLIEIALGLIAACLPGYGLLFWALGFGVLHIIYGGMMYLKYDR